MTLSGVIIAVLCALVMLVAGLRARQAVRHDRHASRGSAPAKGYHVIDASYHSGGGGGGQTAEFRVPRDPQEYARLFIPKDRKP